MASHSISRIRAAVLPILKRRGVSRAGVFGSAARGQLRKGSDVDLLVEIDDSYGLFDFVELKLELEKSLGKKVDLVEYSAIKPALRDGILSGEVRIYEKAG